MALPLWLNTSKSQHSTHRKGHLMINKAGRVRGFYLFRLQLDKRSIWPPTIDPIPPYHCFSWWNKNRPFNKEQVSAGMSRQRGGSQRQWDTQIAVTVKSLWLLSLQQQFDHNCKEMNKFKKMILVILPAILS